MEMQSINALLYHTASNINKLLLQNQLEANWSWKLSELCHHNFIDNIPDYYPWLEMVRHLDNKCRRELALQQWMMEDIIRDYNQRRDPHNPNTGGETRTIK